MTPIQKPSPVHVIELVECSHPVRTYLEGVDKYVAYLEWLVKERDGVIAELREDLYGDGVTDDARDADLLLSECSDTASYGRLVPDVALAEDKHENPPIIDVFGLFPSKTDEKGVEIVPVSVNDVDNETMEILTQCAAEIREERAKSAVIAEKANQDYMNAPVPVSDFAKMTETEQEELTVVAVPAKRRGCPPGGWPKKDPSEVIAKAPKVKKTVDLDALKKVRSNLRPYELLRSNDLLQVVGFIEKFGTRRLGMPEVSDMALYLRIERDLMVTLLKKYGKLHSAGTAIPLILSMHAKNKGKPYPLEELSKISQGFPSVHFPKIPSTQEQISVQ